MINETITINETRFRVIEPDEDRKAHTTWYKCECGQIIKKEKNLDKHTKTKSHETNLINRHYFAIPKQSILRPDIALPNQS